jgi:hypothetical protein
LHLLFKSKEMIMASNSSRKAKHARVSEPIELRSRARARHAPEESRARHPAAEDAAGRRAQREAIKQAMALQNVRLASSPGAIGPIGRVLLLVALVALIALMAGWVLLAL